MFNYPHIPYLLLDIYALHNLIKVKRAFASSHLEYSVCLGKMYTRFIRFKICSFIVKTVADILLQTRKYFAIYSVDYIFFSGQSTAFRILQVLSQSHTLIFGPYVNDIRKIEIHPRLYLVNVVVRPLLFTKLSLFTNSSLDKE